MHIVAPPFRPARIGGCLLFAAALLVTGCDEPVDPSVDALSTGDLHVAPVGATLAGVGTSQTFILADSAGADASVDSVTWFSLAPAVAAADPATGEVTAVMAGQAVIGARIDSMVIGYALVTVSVAGGPIQSWTVDTLASPGDVAGIWSATPETPVAVGSSTALRRTGSGWTDACPGALEQEPADVWGVSDHDLIIPQRTDLIVHVHDGWCGSVEVSTRQFTLTSVWASAPDDAWVMGVWTYYTGLRPILFRWTGEEWRDVSSTVGTNLALYDAWGSNREDVWAVGQSPSQGAVRHFAGNGWAAPALPGGPALHGVWGSSAEDVFAVGLGGRILHYDGSDWSAMASPVTADLYGVGGTAPTDVYAAGDGVVLHYDGSSWSVLGDAPEGAYRSVWATSGPVYFGADGKVVTGNR